MKKRIGVLAVLGFILIFSVRIYSSDTKGKSESPRNIVEQPRCMDIGLAVSLGDTVITLAVEPRGTVTSPLTVNIGGVTYGCALRIHQPRMRLRFSWKLVPASKP